MTYVELDDKKLNDKFLAQSIDSYTSCKNNNYTLDGKEDDIKNDAITKLYRSLIIAMIFLCVELVGGYISGSVAIMTDAAHLLSDNSAYIFSIISIKISQKSSDKFYTYGYHRAEVIGSIISIAMIWLLTILLLFEACERIFHPHPIDAPIMLYTSIFGILANFVMLFCLGHGHSHMGNDDHGHSHDGGHGHSHGGGNDHGHSHGGGNDHGHSHGGGNDHGHGHKNHHEGEMDHQDEHCHDNNDDKYINEENEHYGHSHESNGHGQYNDETKSNDKLVEIELESKNDQNPFLMSLKNLNETSANNRYLKDSKLKINLIGHAHDKGQIIESSTRKSRELVQKPVANVHGHSHDLSQGNMNLYAAYLHILGDLLQSFGVCIAAFIIYFDPTLVICDPICTIVFALLVVCTTVHPIQLSINILMEATPQDLDLDELETELRLCCSVEDIEDLHVWAIAPNKNVMTVSLYTTDHSCCYLEADEVAKKFNIYHSTIQTKCRKC